MVPAIILSLVASVYSFSVFGGVINGSSVADMAAAYGPAVFAILWVRDDSRTSRYWPASHYGLFLWMFWPVMIPHYFWKTRGSGRWLICCLVLLVLILPVLASCIGYIYFDDLPDFR